MDLRNLSRKKQEAWVHLKNAPHHDTTRTRAEYNLKKLTKAAAEKAHNSWWSERVVEAEHQASVVEQQGHGGFLIKDLRLIQKKFSKPAASSLVAKDGTILQTDADKLNRWTEHFQEVVNCKGSIDVPSDDLPVIIPPPPLSFTPLSDNDLDAPLSKEDQYCHFPATIRKGSWPGWNLFGDAPFG